MKQVHAIRQLKALKRLGGQMRLAAEGWKSPWQILIAILMSARTRDEVTIVVATRLFAKYKSLRELASAHVSEIARLIKPVNFYLTKSKSVSGCAKVLEANFRGKPPSTVEELILLPGVGRKTANVFLAEIGTNAIGVDTHVSYISQKLGWTKDYDPRKIEIDLETLFPRRLWRDINMTCVHFGKTYMSRQKKDELLRQVRAL